jgi:phospholipase D1/2
VLHKAGIRPHEVNALSDDDQLDDERTTFTREGVKEPGFASSMVPTMEEMTINKGGLPQAQAADHPIKHTIESGDPDGSLKPSPQTGEGNDLNGASSPLTDSGENPEEARPLDGELYGAPANASAADTEPPHARSGVNDADQQEKEAPRARSVLRKHLNARLGNKIWTLPTPTPKVDPNGFDDPISEHFWQNTWIPCAVHNVSSLMTGTVFLAEVRN